MTLVNKTLQSGFLSEGAVVSDFEKALAEDLGISLPVTTNSGTSALHLALLTLDVQAGDEVILPANTFVASALAIMYVGAIPVFADINPKTGTLDPMAIASKVTPKTVAIMPVHYAGYPCELDVLDAIATEHNLWLIDDAAQALGAVYHGEPIGSGQCDATVFSFQATKQLTTGDGGCVCFYTDDLYRRARRLRWFGIDRDLNLANELGERDYVLEFDVGLKAHMSDVVASIGLGNLCGFEDRIQQRQMNATCYESELSGVPSLELLEYPEDSLPSYYAFGLRVENRLDLVRKLKEHGIPSSILHARIDRHPLFGSGIREDLVGQTEFEAKKLFIPVHEELTSDDLELIIGTIRGGW